MDGSRKDAKTPRPEGSKGARRIVTARTVDECVSLALGNPGFRWPVEPGSGDSRIVASFHKNGEVFGMPVAGNQRVHHFSAEMDAVLRKAGWYPGRKEYEELAKFKFELHECAREFMVEFGGLIICRRLFPEAYIPNLDYVRLMKGFMGVGLKGCLPVALSNYVTDSSMWLGEDGKVYLADEEQIDLVGETVDEGFEILALQKKIHASYPRWKVGMYFD